MDDLCNCVFLKINILKFKFEEPHNNSRVILNHLHMHLGSLLLPIFCGLSHNLHCHPSTTQDHLQTLHQPYIGLPHTRPPHPSNHTVLTHSLHASNASQYSLIYSTHKLPFLFQHFSYTISRPRTTPLVRLLLHTDTRIYTNSSIALHIFSALHAL